jgi:hypothetical protein
LSANPTPVTPAGTMITAVVSDTSGVATLTGGTLKDKLYGTNYGAFQTPGGQGTFDFAMTWTALYQAHPISFAPGATEQRVVTATFYDMQNRTASQDLTLTLSCGDAVSGPCATACKYLAGDSNNCGTCGTVCSSSTVCVNGGPSSFCSCYQGHCAGITSANVHGGASCNATCQSVGGTCTANLCSGFPTGAMGQFNNNIACSAPGPYLCCCD